MDCSIDLKIFLVYHNVIYNLSLKLDILNILLKLIIHINLFGYNLIYKFCKFILFYLSDEVLLTSQKVHKVSNFNHFIR